MFFFSFFVLVSTGSLSLIRSIVAVVPVVVPVPGIVGIVGAAVLDVFVFVLVVVLL